MNHLFLDCDTIVRRCRFDLFATTTTERRRVNNKRLSRRTYAITCSTETPGKNKYNCILFSILLLFFFFFSFFNMIVSLIISEIDHQFSSVHIQYICISMDYSELMAIRPMLYIQIILKKVINKNCWFLDRITGNVQ
jgi:hypothetical protein